MNPDTDPVTLVAYSLRDIEAKKHPRTPGSVVEYCDRCKVPVSVGPRGQREMAARPGSRVLCVDCGVVVAREARTVEVQCLGKRKE